VTETTDTNAELEAEVVREGRVIAAERQTLFSDAVIAIAITLLALELPVPEGVTNAQLWDAARENRPEYIAFLISFVVIWAHWAGHHRIFRYVTSFDPRLGRLNILWLLLQVLTPFASKVISGDDAYQARFGFYALIQALASLIFMAMIWWIRRAKLYRPGTPMHEFDAQIFVSASLVVAFLISIPLSFVTENSWVAWIVVPMLRGFLVRIRGISRRRRRSPENR
jgi:uncharacterized membrane protein